MFVYPLSKSKYKTVFGVFGLFCGWFKLLARFFWKIALSDVFYFTLNFLGNLLKKWANNRRALVLVSFFWFLFTKIKNANTCEAPFSGGSVGAGLFYIMSLWGWAKRTRSARLIRACYVNIAWGGFSVGLRLLFFGLWVSSAILNFLAFCWPLKN